MIHYVYVVFSRDVASVGHNVGSGHKAVLIGDQESDQLGHLVHLTDPPESRLFSQDLVMPHRIQAWKYFNVPPYTVV